MIKSSTQRVLFIFSLFLILIPFVTAQLVKNGAYMEVYPFNFSENVQTDSLSVDSLQITHPTLSAGSKVRLFNPENGIAIFANVSERIFTGEKQPFKLSAHAANQLGMTAQRAFIQMQVAEVSQDKSVSRAVGAARMSSVAIGSGVASYYGHGFHGRRTASGERFDQWGMTAAHRTLPFGTRVKVTNTRTGRSVVVRINDRGPFHGGRVIDLSTAAARAIGMGGTGRVTLERVTGTYQPTAVITPVTTPNQEAAYTLHILKAKTEAELKNHLESLEGAWYVEEQERGETVYNLYYGLFETEDQATAAFSSINALGFGGVVKRI